MTVVLCPLGGPPVTFFLPARETALRTVAVPVVAGCAGDLLKMLRAVGKRLTVQRLLEELRERSQAGEDVQAWSERKVSNTATALVQLGYLTTSKVTDPPGYGLPEWGEGPGPGPALGLPPSMRNGMAHAERNGDVEELAER